MTKAIVWAWGETISGSEFDLVVTVEAASWVPVETLNVYINGELHHQQAVALDADTLVRSERIMEIFDELETFDWCTMIADKSLCANAR